MDGHEYSKLVIMNSNAMGFKLKNSSYRQKQLLHSIEAAKINKIMVLAIIFKL